MLESFKGTSIVRWYGNIERQLIDLVKKYDDAKNITYTDKLRKFLEVWRSNIITGSINREVLDTLLSAAEILAVDAWPMENYFSTLRDSLRVLIASEEELPRMPMGAGGGAGGGGGGLKAPSIPRGRKEEPPVEFGPEKEEPTGPGSESAAPDLGQEGEEKTPTPAKI